MRTNLDDEQEIAELKARNGLLEQKCRQKDSKVTQLELTIKELKKELGEQMDFAQIWQDKFYAAQGDIAELNSLLKIAVVPSRNDDAICECGHYAHFQDGTANCCEPSCACKKYRQAGSINNKRG